MTEIAAQASHAAPVAQVMRDELVRGDAVAASIPPILRHLLANDEHSVFSDEIIAAMRGMMAHVARQLLDAQSQAAGMMDSRDHGADRITALVHAFVGHAGFLAHVHALALEWQLTCRLQSRLSLDPVLSPLLQALTASTEPAVASNAMALMAAQARFAQTQRRMQLPLQELPGDLLHAALLALRAVGSEAAEQEANAVAADQAIRSQYDESRSRLGLIARLVLGMGGGAVTALSVSHAGVAMFLSALSIATGQDRDMVVLTTNESQVARLALALSAAGMKHDGIAEQFLAIHPEITLPQGIEYLGSDHAAALLARAAPFAGG